MMKIFEKVAKSFNELYLDSPYIQIDPKTSTITLKIQDGPIKESGENGCQIEILGEIWRAILDSFNTDFPCRENSLSITKIDEALLWQLKRKINHTTRGVEGYNKA